MRGARRAGVVLLSTLLMVGGLLAPPAGAAAGKETRLAEQLVRQVTVGGANRHLIALQRIADTAGNNGTRAVANGTTVQNPTGYQASVDYVARQMRGYGFQVQVKDFTYPVSDYVADVPGGDAPRVVDDVDPVGPRVSFVDDPG